MDWEDIMTWTLGTASAKHMYTPSIDNGLENIQVWLSIHIPTTKLAYAHGCSCKEHMYIVGSLVQQHLSTMLCELLEVPPSSQVQTFTRTFYNGVRYHSKAYIKGQGKRKEERGKRNDQICHFNSTGQCKFGQIELFVLTPDPVAIVKVFQSTEATLLQQAGQPCRQVLEEYKRINILSSFVHEIKPPEEHSHLEVIPIRHQGKAVYVQLDNSLYDYVLTPMTTTESMYSNYLQMI